MPPSPTAPTVAALLARPCAPGGGGPRSPGNGPLTRLLGVFLVLALAGCDVGYLDSIPGVSESVAESKRRNVFLQELTLQRNFSTPAFRVESAWLEKRWTHTGYRFSNTTVISRPFNYVSLVVVLSREQGDTLLVNATTHEFPDSHMRKKAWFVTPRPTSETITFKMAYQELVLPNDSCTFRLSSADK